MAVSRYIILEPGKPHFMTCTVIEWLPVFTRPDSVRIIIDSRTHQRTHDGLQLFGYVIPENHLHFVAQAPRLDKCLNNLNPTRLPGASSCWRRARRSVCDSQKYKKTDFIEK